MAEIISLGASDTLGNSGVNSKVGIGTTNPAELLHAVGGKIKSTAVNTPAVIAHESNNGTVAELTHSAVGTTSNSAFSVKTNGTNRITVDTSGNVGIGTASPTSPLCISGAAGSASTAHAVIGDKRLRFKQNASKESNAGCIDYAGFDSTSLSLIGEGTSSSNRNVRIYDTLTVGYAAPTAGVAAFNGKVGIGTSNPGSNSLRIVTADYSNSEDVLAIDAASPYATNGMYKGLVWSYEGGSVVTRIATVMRQTGDFELAFFTTTSADVGVTEQVRIDRDGNVGINEANPTSKLHLQGSFAVKRTATASSTSTDDEVIIGVTSTAAARTITLATADCVAGRIIIIKDESGAAGTNHITVATEGVTEKIDGADSKAISTDFGVIRLYSNGVNWFTI